MPRHVDHGRQSELTRHDRGVRQRAALFDDDGACRHEQRRPRRVGGRWRRAPRRGGTPSTVVSARPGRVPRSVPGSRSSPRTARRARSSDGRQRAADRSTRAGAARLVRLAVEPSTACDGLQVGPSAAQDRPSRRCRRARCQCSPRDVHAARGGDRTRGGSGGRLRRAGGRPPSCSSRRSRNSAASLAWRRKKRRRTSSTCMRRPSRRPPRRRPASRRSLELGAPYRRGSIVGRRGSARDQLW